MGVRNIQRTGKMHYVYLPTNWCQKFGINSKTKIFLTENSDGSILLSPQQKEQKGKTIEVTLPSKYKNALINLIMACYVNPTTSFKIDLENKIDMKTLLDQKNIMSGLEFVELDGENITYESSLSVNEPDALLKTMVKKIKNLFYIMENNYSAALIRKYEEEIDRSKILIQKSVISSMVLNQSTALKSIDMHYTLQIAIELERMIDHAIQFDSSDAAYLKTISPLIDMIKELVEKTASLEYVDALEYTHLVIGLKEFRNDNLKNANKNRIKRYLQNISEVVLDWAITREIENK